MTSDTNRLNKKALSLFEHALDQPAKTREHWIVKQAGKNIPLRNKALSYLTRDKDANNAFHTGGAFHETLDDTAIPEHIGAYKITGLIGRGGMGAVYRGKRIRGDFDHDVAIKVVRPGALSDKLVARFQNERQTLANLSHPNIARLYDGGTLDNGAPYIVMEYIDGLPITHWADENTLGKTQRLALFQSACDAVAHAHQNLIIHRDITPSNVLVDKVGHVKLIDFGIAKPFDADAAIIDTDHSLASLSFTPGFAAPERSKGASANTLSDIYSLGKLLKALFKDQLPNTEISSIAEKSSALSPQKRYKTVGAITEDVKNHLKGYPVGANGNSSPYRFKKFVSRHKIGALFTSIAVIGLLSAFTITLFQYQRAEAALVEADKRFEDVRELAKFQLFDLYDQLETIPGNTKPLSSIADKSRIYLDALSQNKNASVQLRLETAIGYKRLSDVVGNPITANLGRRKETALLIKKAYDDMEALLKENPENIDVMRAFAEAAFSFSVFEFIAEDDTAATIKFSKKSAALYSQIIENGNARESDYLGRFRAELQEARNYYWDGKGKEGILVLEALSKKFAKYSQTHPYTKNAQFVEAAIQTETGLTIVSTHEPLNIDVSNAIPYLNRTIAIYKDLQTKYPNELKAQRNIVGAYYKRALIHAAMKSYDEMLNDLEKADAIAFSFLQKDSNDKGMERILLAVREQISRTLAQLGRHGDAIELGKKNLIWQQHVFANNSSSPGRARELANAHHSLALIYSSAKQTKQACKTYEDSMTIWKDIEARWGFTEFDKKGSVKTVQENLDTCPH